MASLQESITTVSGRRCTRSRARTAATSTALTEEPTLVAPTEVTTSTAVEAPQVQTSAAGLPPPPGPPAPSASATTPAEQPVAAPTTEAAAASSAPGTSSAIPMSSVPHAPLAALASSAPAASSSQAPDTTAVPATSDPVAIAVPSRATGASSIAPSRFTAPAASAVQSPPQAPPGSDPTAPTPGRQSATNTPLVHLPQPTTSVVAALPSGGSAGIIGPDQNPDNDSPLTLPGMGDANIGSIVGGVIGGVAAFALISGLLFFCLRKRKSRPVRWSEKRAAGPHFVDKLKTVPAAVGVFIAKLKGSKAGPMGNSYQRHTAQTSVSSVYSTNSNNRVRSTSEPHNVFAVQRAGSVRSTSSKKSERNLLRKKPSSISSDYRFPGVLGVSSIEKGNGGTNPFADHEPLKLLSLLNPDPKSAPVTPQLPAATADRIPKDPFASTLDQSGDIPAWVRSSTIDHKRTQSSTSARRSHPSTSVYALESSLFKSPPSQAPPAPTQVVLPGHARRSSTTYPAFNTTSTTASRDSQFTLFGEPGPSRPVTRMFTPGLTTGRTIRQSDPFDLDRPEVLGFGSVPGRREVRASVTRQATRTKRVSSVGSWANATDGPYEPYERDSTRPGPVWSANNRR